MFEPLKYFFLVATWPEDQMPGFDLLHDREFKREAVRLVTCGDKTLIQACPRGGFFTKRRNFVLDRRCYLTN